MDVIKNLYFGELSPVDAITPNRTYREMMDQLLELEDRSCKTLQKEQQKQVEQYADLLCDMSEAQYADYFSLGFRMGIRFGAQGRTKRRNARARRRLRNMRYYRDTLAR